MRAEDRDSEGRRWWGPLFVAGLALVLASWAPGPTTLTVDETSWLSRSERFANAVRDRDFDRATSRYLDVPSTMPGVTTMVAGSAGRALAHVGDRLGLSGPVAQHSRDSPQVLRAGRFVVSLLCAAGLALIVAYASRLISRRAALVGGTLLAVEPFLLGHAGVLHTDALLTVLSTLSVIAWAAATGTWARPGEAAPRGGFDRRAALVSGVAGGLALLTKVTALATLGSALLVVLALDLARVAWGADAGRRSWRVVLEDRAALAATWLLAAAVTFVVLWPALWTSPMTQLSHLRESIELGDQAYPTFFRGEAVVGPGRAFLVTTMPFRMSPWLFAGAVASLVATVAVAIDRRRRAPAPRTLLVALVLAAVPYLVAVSGATKAYDRYALPLWPYLALLVGVWVDHAVTAARPPVRVLRIVTVAVVVALALPALALAPYRTAYVSPLLGGQQRAVDEIPLGWGEGVEQLGEVIAEREEGRCDAFEVVARSDADIALPCGVLVDVRTPGATGPFYVVRVIANIQRPIFDPYASQVRERGTLLETVEIDGVTYAELWSMPS